MIAFVVGGDGHDGAGAVAGEDVVGDPDGDAYVVDRVDGIRAGEDAGFFFRGVLTVAVGFGGGGFDVVFDVGALFGSGDGGDERMLGGENHVSGAEERVGAGGVDGEFITAFEREIHEGAFGASNPIFLQELDRIGPVEGVESVEQTFGERGDAEHPLAHRSALDGKAADFAFAIDDFFVGEHGAEFGAPVDGHFGDVGEADAIQVRARVGGDGFGAVGGGVEPRVVNLQEDPLGPADVVGVGGVDLARPVVAEADAVELFFETGSVVGGGDGGVLSGFDRVLFGGQAEGVPAHRVENVVAAHAVPAGEDIGGGVTLGVPDVKAFAARVGKHVEHVVLRLGGIEVWLAGVGSAEGCGFGPVLLPLGFELRERVLFALARHGACRR